mgnify:CR=1 FL=1
MVKLFGGAAADYWETLRSVLIPLVGKQIARINSHSDTGYYVSYPTGRDEYALQVQKDEESFEEDLEAMGFERNPVAAFKTLAGTSYKEEGSWYMVHSNNDLHGLDLPSDAIPYVRDGQNDFQLHLILYEVDGDENTTVVFAHHELWWGAYPLSHYRGRYYDPEFGQALLVEIMKDYYDDFDDVVSFKPIDDIIDGNKQ